MLPPLPPGEGWGEGNCASPAKQDAHSAHALMTNLLIQHRFPPKHASQLSALAIKIAKRRSLGNTPWLRLLLSRRLKAANWGLSLRGGSLVFCRLTQRVAKPNRRASLRQPERDKQGCGKTVKQRFRYIRGKRWASLRSAPTYDF